MPEGAEASVLHSRTKRGDQWDASDLESFSHVRRTGWGDCRRRINSDFAVFYEWLQAWVHLPLGPWTSAPQDAMTSYLTSHWKRANPSTLSHTTGGAGGGRDHIHLVSSVFGLNSYEEAIQPVTTVKPAERKWRGDVRVCRVRV